MKPLFKKTYPKILLLFLSSSVFFIFLYFALYVYTRKVESQVYTASKVQLYNEVQSFLILDSKPITVAINNDSNWDEFVNFISTKDANWYNETIGNEQEIYKVDYLGAYDQDGKFIIRTASSKIKSIEFNKVDEINEIDRFDKFDELQSKSKSYKFNKDLFYDCDNISQSFDLKIGKIKKNNRKNIKLF